MSVALQIFIAAVNALVPVLQRHAEAADITRATELLTVGLGLFPKGVIPAEELGEARTYLKLLQQAILARMDRDVEELTRQSEAGMPK